MHAIRIKRIYNAPDVGDGIRVLVDRLWPRGLDKSQARIDYWMKEVAPSTELRKWFGHDDARWEAFRSRYLDELAGKDEAMAPLRELIRTGPVTLLYSARSPDRNNAVVLAGFLAAAHPPAS